MNKKQNIKNIVEYEEQLSDEDQPLPTDTNTNHDHGATQNHEWVKMSNGQFF